MIIVLIIFVNFADVFTTRHKFKEVATCIIGNYISNVCHRCVDKIMQRCQFKCVHHSAIQKPFVG